VKTFALTIPTKSYIRKYIHSRYGYPVVLNNKTLFGTVMISLLEKKAYSSGARDIHKATFSTYRDKVEMVIPQSYIIKNIHGLHISIDKAIVVNRYYENQFEEDLYHFCKYNLTKNGKHPGYDVAICQFAERHCIEFDVDITFEALKKMEYRFRKNLEKKDYEFVPSTKVHPLVLFSESNM
jgi:hypothetical protein